MKSSFCLAAVSLIGLSGTIPAAAQTSTTSPCDRFHTQQEAQAFFENDPTANIALDPDNDGIACESISSVVRSDGRRVSSGSTSDGWSYEVWESRVNYQLSNGSSTVYYVKAWHRNAPQSVLSTGNYLSQSEALQYFTSYLQ